MPQMAPLNWLILFMMFSVIFLIFNIMNYYSFFPLTPKSKNFNKKDNFSLNWKW